MLYLSLTVYKLCICENILNWRFLATFAKHLLNEREVFFLRKMVKDFPLSPLEQLARDAGAERISVTAVKELKTALLEISEKIATEAVAACNHAKRVTIKREDIQMAVR